MGKDSGIEWTHHTFNPWWGCARVSPGCENCYAETFAHRLGRDKLWGVKGERRFFGDKHWADPLKWNAAAERAGERHRVFCASMADVFEDRDDLVGHRARLFALVEDTPHLDWLLLTKRPENADRLWSEAKIRAHEYEKSIAPVWARNVWLGTTVEDQRRADERIQHLLRVPAAVRFLSCEPLLERVDLRLNQLKEGCGPRPIKTTGIDWVIVGGESGTGARRFNVEWARGIVAQCRTAGVAIHVKQLGANVVDRNDRFNTCQDTDPELADHWPLDDPDRVEENINGFREEYQGAPVRIRLLNKKGSNCDEWPPDLRIREYPEARS